jgi:transposase
VGLTKSHWSRRYIQWLKEIKFQTDEGRKALDIQIDRLLSLREKLTELIKELRKLSNNIEYKDDIKLLMSISGIGMLTALYLLFELVDIKRFKNVNKLCGYFGLYPGENSTSDNIKIGPITKRGKSFLRYLLIEAAWVVIRKDPALMMAFNTFTKTTTKQNAIIKIARKLLSRIHYVLRTKQPYVIGIVE